RSGGCTMNTSHNKVFGFALAAAGLIAVGALVGYRIARHGVHSPDTTARSATRTPQTDRQILYWYDPMQPGQHFDTPGKSPFMDMQLIPKYADRTAGEDKGFRIEPVLVQNLGIRYTTVQRAPLPQTVDAVGTVGFNQRDVAIVQTRSTGF